MAFCSGITQRHDVGVRATSVLGVALAQYISARCQKDASDTRIWSRA